MINQLFITTLALAGIEVRRAMTSAATKSPGARTLVIAHGVGSAFCAPGPA